MTAPAPMSPERRAKILATARDNGRRAGQAYRDHGTVPKPLNATSLIARQYATEWHRGFDEGRHGAH